MSSIGGGGSQLTADAIVDGQDEDNDLDAEEERSALERALLHAKTGLFGVLFIMAKETTQSALVVIIEIIIDFLQVLSFILANSFAWNSAWMGWLSTATRISRFHWYLEISPTTTQAIFFIALAAVLLVLLNAAYVGVTFSRGKRLNLLLVKTLRSTAGILVTVLFLPLIDIFASRFAVCDVGQLHIYSSECVWQGPEIIVKIVAIIAIILLTTLSLAVEATFFDESPESKGILSRPHARIDVAYLLYKALISILDSVLDLDQAKQQWALVAVLAGGSFLFSYLYTWYPAYYRFGYSKLRATALWCLAWASAALVCVQISYDSDSNAGPVLFYVGLPLAALAGSLAISERRRHILEKDIFRITSPYEIELKVRFMLEPLVNKRRRIMAGLDQSDADATIDGDCADGKLIAQAGEVYRKALRTIGGNSLLHVFQSQFFYATSHNGVLGARALAKASRSAPFSIDEQFFVYRRQQMCQEYFSSNASESRDVIMYMTLMQSIQTVRRVEGKCLGAQSAFWNELLSTRPDSTRLRGISSVINENIALGQKSFRTLLRMSPDSPQVCRMYANWVGSVMFDQDKKVRYLNKAAMLESGHEETAENEGSGGGGALTMFSGVSRLDLDGLRDGSRAVLRLLCDEERLGTIETVNASAMRLFGCVRHDLIGRDFTVILSEPFVRAYQSAAQAYVLEGSLEIRGSKNVFFKNKGGFLFPGRLTVKDIPGQGVLPSFVAIVEPVVTSARDHFALVNDDGFIVGCTANCLALYPELRVEDMLDYKMHISALIPGYDATMAQQMATTAGAKLSIASDAQADTGDYSACSVWESKLSTCDSEVRVVRILTSDESTDQRGTPYDRIYHSFPKKEQNGSLYNSFDGSRIRATAEQFGRPSPNHCERPSTGLSGMPTELPMERTSSVRFNATGRGSLKRCGVSITVPEGGTEEHEMEPIARAVIHHPPTDATIAIVLDEIEIPHAMPDGDEDAELSKQSIPPLERCPKPTNKPDVAYDVRDDNLGYTMQVRQQQEDADVSRPLGCGDRRKSEGHLGDGHSSASGRSNSSVKRVNALRRILVETNNKGLSPVLRTFRMVVLFTLAALVAMAIAQYVVEKQEIQTVRASFDELTTVGDIRFNAISAGLFARFLSLANTGLKPKSQIDLFRNRLAATLEGLDSGYKSIMARVPQMSTRNRALYQTLSLNITTAFDLATLKLIARETTLAEALKTDISQIRQLLNTNTTGLSISESIYLLPLINGLDSSQFSSAMNSSSTFTCQQVDTSIDEMGRKSLAICVSGLVVALVLSVFVILPTILYVERTSENTLRVFEEVPRDTIRKMRHRCNKKVKELQEDNNSGSESDSESGEGDGPEESGRATYRSGRRRLSTAPKEMAQRTMVFTRSWKYVAKMALKISAYLVLGVVFFSLTYYVGYVSIERDLREGAVRANYATYIRTSARSVLWSTLDTSAGLTPASVLASIFNTAKYELSEISRGLEIGSAVFEIPPQRALSGSHNSLLYDNACQVLDVAVANATILSDCERIGNGIFEDGLSQAVVWYLSRISQLYDVPGVNFTGADTFNFLNRVDVVEIERLEHEYLQPALQQSVEEYTARITSLISTRNSSFLALLLTFIILSVFVYVVIYNRLIHSLDVEMKRTRSMMLMLPDDILGQMTWLDAYMSELAGRHV